MSTPGRAKVTAARRPSPMGAFLDMREIVLRDDMRCTPSARRAHRRSLINAALTPSGFGHGTSDALADAEHVSRCPRRHYHDFTRAFPFPEIHSSPHHVSYGDYRHRAVSWRLSTTGFRHDSACREKRRLRCAHDTKTWRRADCFLGQAAMLYVAFSLRAIYIGVIPHLYTMTA